MSRAKHTTRFLAAMLVVLVPMATIPAHASTGRLAGTVYSALDDSPLAGVKVYAANPETGQVFPSQPTSVDGAFEIVDLPAGTFELGVAIDEGLYLVRTPSTLR